jgi:hypothetical protein
VFQPKHRGSKPWNKKVLRVANANVHTRVEINSHLHWHRLNNSHKINYMDSDTDCSLALLFEGESKRKSFFFWKNSVKPSSKIDDSIN